MTGMELALISILALVINLTLAIVMAQGGK